MGDASSGDGADAASAEGDQRRRRAIVLVLCSFAAAVATFLAATVATTTRLDRVSIEAERIAARAMPNLLALATVRQHLRELVANLYDEGASPPAAKVADLARTVERLGAQLRALDATAFSDRAQDDWPRARALVEGALQTAQRADALVAAGRADEARTLVQRDLRPEAAAADEALWKLVELDATESARDARAIDRTRRNSTVLLYGLDALSVAMAALLANLALRSLSRYMRLADARSRELEMFAVRVAHDVRDPLAPPLHALRRAREMVDDTSPLRPVLDRGIRSLDRVVSLVDDLFEFAKAGGRPHPGARCHALAAARACIEEVRPLADAKAIEVVVDPSSVDCIVACGDGALIGILSNLARNAIKYMGTRPVRRVAVRVERRDGGARFEVRDTGPGVPAAAAATLFEPYVRGDRTGQPGLGLGLATVKRLVEAHGGRVGFRSGDAGATFWFELPVAETAPEAGPLASVPST